ncbi:MAG: 1,4-beta-D-glucan glucohydrolase [Paucibacter sp.]|nr:1,4-beta-D-glucan glucohydrolase [Roseateles sp.]
MPYKILVSTVLGGLLGLLVAPAFAAPDIVLYDGHTQPHAHIAISDFEGHAVLDHASVTVPKPATPRVPDSSVSAHRGKLDGHKSALTLAWHQAWFASLGFEGGAPLDLRPYLADGVLAFDIKVSDLAKGGLFVKLACGKDCERKLNFILQARALEGQGWQHLAFPLACFVRDGDDFAKVPLPFAVETSGSGEFAIADVRLRARPAAGEALQSCPDYRTASVTPSPLIQVWSLEWWMPRHEEKLAEIRRRQAAHEPTNLVFIGDSITHNWEKDGAKVWERWYAPQHALDLGFGGYKTENVLWRLQHGEVDGIAPKVAVLMIGTNNTGDRQEDPRTTAAGVRRLLDELRARLPGTRILLLAVFPRSERSDDVLRRLNNEVNGLISGFADGRNIVFLNINEHFTGAGGSLSREVMPDLLHPNEHGYELWADAMAPTLQAMLNAPSTQTATHAAAAAPPASAVQP